MADVYSCHAILTAPLLTQTVVVYAFIHNLADTGLAKVKWETCLPPTSPSFPGHSLVSIFLRPFLSLLLVAVSLCYCRIHWPRWCLYFNVHGTWQTGTASRNDFPISSGAFNGGALPVMALDHHVAVRKSVRRLVRFFFLAVSSIIDATRTSRRDSGSWVKR